MKKIPSKILPLVLILTSILAVFSIQRLYAYFVIVTKTLPPVLFLSIGGYRLHHFVYGNIIILVTSFFAIALGINKHKKLFYIFYGVGLGLVLDEFLLWMGNVKQLTSSVVWIPYSLTVIAVASMIIATFIMIRLRKSRPHKR